LLICQINKWYFLFATFDAVFQGLDPLTKFAEVVNDKTGGDYSAVEFCNVLKYLRKVSNFFIW